MTKNVVTEYISLVFLSILMSYSRGSFKIPTNKNRVYHFCQYGVLATIVITILNNTSQLFNDKTPDTILETLFTLHHIALPFLVVLFTLYSLVLIDFQEEAGYKMWRTFFLVSIPFGIYLLILLQNVFLQNLFYVQEGFKKESDVSVCFSYSICLFYIGLIFYIIFSGREKNR